MKISFQESIHLSNRLSDIDRKLKYLQSIDLKFYSKAFGAIHHRFKSTKVSSDDIETFERINGIIIPDDYRAFLTEIGYGAGPDYGILSLEQSLMEYMQFANNLNPNSKLSSPFELTGIDAFNITLNKANNTNDMPFKRLSSMNGILPIQTEGCTYFSFIVITGETRGSMWSLNIEEFDAMPIGVTKELTFFDWYENWLNECLTKIEDQASR